MTPHDKGSATGHQIGRKAARLLGSGGKRVREIDPAWQRVAFVTDPSQGMYDRFGRTLAYLDKADGWDYSVEAARAGAAHS